MEKTAKKSMAKKSGAGLLLAEVRTEWNKIIWPDREEAFRKAAGVMAAAGVLAVCLAGWDSAAQALIALIMG